MGIYALVLLILLMGKTGFSEVYPGDQWRFSKPQDEGLDSIAVESYLKGLPFATTCSVLVKNGKLIGNYQGHKTKRIVSIGKTIHSMAIGIAIKEGLLDLDSEGPVASVRQHLQQNYRGHWQYEPYKGQVYGTQILNKYVGRAESFIQRKLFDKLQMQQTKFDPLLGKSFHVSSCLDLARLGLLLAREGRWQGEELIPADYFNEAKQPLNSNSAYGFLLWLNRAGEWQAGGKVKKRHEYRPIPGAPDDMIIANGIGGQIIFAIPSLDLVVVRMGYDRRIETMYTVWDVWDGVADIVKSAYDH